MEACMSPKALRAKGNQAYSQGNLNEALLYYSRCMESICIAGEEKALNKELEREVVLAASNRAQVHLALKHFELALEDANKALSSDPTHLKSLFRKAKALYGIGKHEQAVDCLEVAMREPNGEAPDIQTQIQIQKEAMALLKLGRMHVVEAQKHKIFCHADTFIRVPVDSKKIGSGRGGLPLVAPMCGNKDCMNEAASRHAQVCKACNLVSYCSSQCRKLHAKDHRAMCTVVPVRWKPTAASKSGYFDEKVSSVFLWGNVPAITSLSPKNPHLPAHLRLCFAASGDLRDMLTTITQLPESYKGKVSILMNDNNCQVLMRNFIMLEMLRCYGKDAIDCVIAMWYSDAMTLKQSRACQAAGWDALKRCGYLERSVATLAACRTGSCQRGPSLLVAPFKGGLSTLSVDYGDEHWGLLFQYLANYDQQPSTIVAARLKSCMSGYAALMEEGFVPEPLRVAWCQFHCGNGLMLPFSSTMDSQFMAGNMFLLHPVEGEWQQNSVADPLSSWEYKDFQHASQEFGVPCEDLYGALFFHVRKVLVRFVEVLERTRVEIKLVDRDARLLAEELKRDSFAKFHAISTSNIADTNYVGMQQVLCDWGPLLESNGTLLTMQMHWFMGAISNDMSVRMLGHNIIQIIKKTLEIREEAVADIRRMATAAIERFMNLEPMGRMQGPVVNVKISAEIYGWCTRTDIAYAKHLTEGHINQVAAQIGLEARANHVCVPTRLGVSLDACQAAAPKDYCSSLGELKLHILSRKSFLERYVEWTTKHL